jgi:cell division protein FtsB
LVTHIFDELAKPTAGPNDQEQYQRLLERLETSQTLRREAEQKRELATHERLERTEQLARVKHERSEAHRDAARGGAHVKALAPTGELPQIADRVADELRGAGAAIGSEVVSAAEIRDGVASLIEDPELLRRAIGAIPDETTRARLLNVLGEPRINELLSSAARGTRTRDNLLRVLVDPSATEAAENLVPDEVTRRDVRQLGDQLVLAYRGALELRAVATEIRGLWGNLRYLWRHGTASRRRMIGLAASFGALAAAGLITLLIASFVLPSLPIAAIASAIAGVVGFTTVTMKAIRQPLRQVSAAVELAVETVDHKARRQIEQLEALELELQRDIDTARREEHEAEREIQDIRRGRRLQTYIEERARAGDYRSQLGVVAQVRKDFTRLAELMEQARLAREANDRKDAVDVERTADSDDLPPIDRIVLYIDDLDRCPTDRVVQVLEAVHLLLALKLFVVVVGVDSRWLMQSLRHHYAAQMRGPGGQPFTRAEDRSYWESTPQNYLEKIFQIPFSIRSMDKSGYKTLMGQLFKPAGLNTKAPVASTADEQLADTSHTEAPALQLTRPTKSEPSPSPPPRALGSPSSSRPAVTTSSGPGATASSPARTVTTSSGPGAPASSPARTVSTTAQPSRHFMEATPINAITEADTTTEKPQGEQRVLSPAAAPPEALSIADEELRFLQALVDFVPTPRAAKRLANTYRLIRVLLTPTEYAQYSASTDEHYKIVLTLLGILVGFPEQATTVFEEIMTSPVREWSTFKCEVIDKAGRSERPSNTDTPEPNRGEDNQPSGTEAVTTLARGDEWDRLSNALRDLDSAMSLPTNMTAYRRWARNVARYSFHTGRLAAGASDGADRDRGT